MFALGMSSTSASGEEVVIGMSSPSLADAGQQVIAAGVKTWVEKQGWKLVAKNANGVAKDQATQIEALIEQKVSAIIMVPADAAAICAPIAKAKAAGIPIFAIDRLPDGCEVAATVLADNYVAGKDSGGAMVELLKKKYGSAKGIVLEIQGDMSSITAQDRGNGFDDVIKKYKNITLIKKPTKWTEAEFSKATRDVASTKKLDGIYMHSDCVGSVVVTTALESVNKLYKRGNKNHIFLTGVDGCAATMKVFKDGYFDATSSQALPDFGSITNLVKIVLDGGKIQEGPFSATGSAGPIVGKIKNGPAGPTLALKTIPVTPKTANNPLLWGNAK
jgi:ABC-type sugar transport system substrate-binding protein